MIEGHVWEKSAGGKKCLHMGRVVDSSELKCNIRYVYIHSTFWRGNVFCCASPLLDLGSAGIHLRNAHSLSLT